MKSKIEWTESTWNPITGCTKVSPGCKNCYAERMAFRLQAMNQPRYKNGFQVTLHEEALFLPLEWKKPQLIFVNSMSDLFHEDVPITFVKKIFRIMNEANQHVFQILTKRAERLLELSDRLPWSDNIWMGVSVENRDYLYRIDLLRQTSARIKFISFEPLLGPVGDSSLEGIDWTIAGGESGPGSRPIDPDWVRSIRDHCIASNVPFFFKQWGGINKKAAGRTLDDRTWDELPENASSLT